MTKYPRRAFLAMLAASLAWRPSLGLSVRRGSPDPADAPTGGLPGRAGWLPPAGLKVSLS